MAFEVELVTYLKVLVDTFMAIILSKGIMCRILWPPCGELPGTNSMSFPSILVYHCRTANASANAKARSWMSKPIAVIWSSWSFKSLSEKIISLLSVLWRFLPSSGLKRQSFFAVWVFVASRPFSGQYKSTKPSRVGLDKEKVCSIHITTRGCPENWSMCSP